MRLRLALLALLALGGAANAQMSGVRVVSGGCGSPAPWPALQTSPLSLASVGWLTVDTNYNLCTGGTFSFSWPGTAGNAIGGATTAGTMPYVNAYVVNGTSSTVSSWTPSYAYSNMTVSNTSSTVALPTGATTGSVIRIFNRGLSQIYWTAGASPVATSGMAMVPPNAEDTFVVPAGTTTFAAITSSSGQTAAVNLELGTGLPAQTGGPINQAVGVAAAAAVSFNTIGGTDNSTTIQPIGATAAGTSSTKNALAIQGVTSGVPVPISQASGSVASGAYSAGAFVSGSFVAGALADGAITTIGTEADTAWVSGSGTEIAILKKIAGNTASFSGVVTNAGTFAVQNTAATPAGSNTIGAVTQASGPWTINKTQVSGSALGAVVSNLGTLASGTPAVENVNAYIVGGAGSGGTAAADAAAWTAGTTNQTPIGCEFTSGGATAIVTAHMGTVGCTAARAQLTDKTSVGGTALAAATSAYGTAPTGTAVEGVNAFVTNTNANGSNTSANSSPVVNNTMSHASTTALGTSLVVKASAGNLGDFNCVGIAGGAAGYCIVYNGTSAPSTGALTGANVLDACQFDTSAKGCSLTRLPNSIAYSTGIVILISSAASPYTYTTGTDTGAIFADYF